MRRALATLAIAAAALPLAACGKDTGSPIPQKQADSLINGLETARRQATAGSCLTLLNTTLPALETRAKNLDSSVGSDVRQTIQDGVNHLRDLADKQCSAAQQQQQTTTDTTQSTSESTSSTTDSTQSTDTSSTDTNTNTNTDTNTNTTTGTDTTPTTGTDTTPTTGTDTSGGGATPPPANTGTTPPPKGATP